jgi:hypothetical protein
MVHTGELCQYGGNFLTSKHGWHPAWPFGAFEGIEGWKILVQYVAVEEQEGVQGDILRRRRHPTVDGEMCQKGTDLLGTHILGMAFLVEQDKAPAPANVRLFGTATQMSEAKRQAHLIEQLCS